MEKLRLGEVMVAEGLLTPAQLQQAIACQARFKKKLGQAVVDLGLLTSEQLLSVLSRRLGVPLVRTGFASIPIDTVKRVPAHLLRRWRVCPMRLEWPGPRGVLTLATSHPEDLTFLDEIAFATGFVVRPVLARNEDIERVLRRCGVLAGGSREAMELPPIDDGEAFVIMRNAHEDDVPQA